MKDRLNEVSVDKLITFLQDNLARYKVPKSVAFMADLPMSSMGKILKRELRQYFMS